MKYFNKKTCFNKFVIFIKFQNNYFYLIHLFKISFCHLVTFIVKQ